MGNIICYHGAKPPLKVDGHIVDWVGEMDPGIWMGEEVIDMKHDDFISQYKELDEYFRDLIVWIGKNIPRRSGIYAIRWHKMFYVGATKNLRQRLKQHVYAAHRGNNSTASNMLQEPATRLHILEFVDDLSLLSYREIIWINRLNSINSSVFPHHKWIGSK